jgi:hypothetical protein
MLSKLMLVCCGLAGSQLCAVALAYTPTPLFGQERLDVWEEVNRGLSMQVCMKECKCCGQIAQFVCCYVVVVVCDFGGPPG